MKCQTVCTISNSNPVFKLTAGQNTAFCALSTAKNSAFLSSCLPRWLLITSHPQPQMQFGGRRVYWSHPVHLCLVPAPLQTWLKWHTSWTENKIFTPFFFFFPSSDRWSLSAGTMSGTSWTWLCEKWTSCGSTTRGPAFATRRWSQSSLWMLTPSWVIHGFSVMLTPVTSWWCSYRKCSSPSATTLMKAGHHSEGSSRFPFQVGRVFSF